MFEFEIFDKFNWLIHPLFLSAKVIAVSCALFVILGLPLAYLIATYKGKFKAFLECVVMFPLIFPPIATGFLLLYIFGKSGLIGKYLHLNLVFSFWALVIAAFLAGLPLFVKPVSVAFESFPKNLIEAGFSLGKNKFQIFIYIVLPSLIKNIVSALILALSRSLGEVGITLMLGGNIIGKTDTISLAIYNAVYDGENEKALVFSLILVVLGIFMFYFTNKLTKK